MQPISHLENRGGARTVVVVENFTAMCSKYNLPVDLVLGFMRQELYLTCELSSPNAELILRGNHAKQVRSYFKQVFQTLVQCSFCKSTETILGNAKHEFNSPLLTIECTVCDRVMPVKLRNAAAESCKLARFIPRKQNTATRRTAFTQEEFDAFVADCEDEGLSFEDMFAILFHELVDLESHQRCGLERALASNAVWFQTLLFEVKDSDQMLCRFVQREVCHAGLRLRVLKAMVEYGLMDGEGVGGKEDKPEQDEDYVDVGKELEEEEEWVCV